VAECLERTRDDLAALDRCGLGNPVAAYLRIRDRLCGISSKVDLTKLFQVDLMKGGSESVLSRPLVEKIRLGAEILSSISHPQPDPLREFRAAFIERYERREVPLCEALDEELGVGFGRSTAPEAVGAPLLDGLPLAPGAEAAATPWGPREVLLLRKLHAALASSEREITLDDEDIGMMKASRETQLPDAFHAIVRLIAAPNASSLDDAGILFISLSGPSGARLLGRFCHHDDTLRRHVEAHLRAEEALEPEAVFAEVVHLRNDRVGNLVCRPLLREFEIPFLGQSGAPRERQIAITDLTVSVVGDTVVLKSVRSGRRVIPRMTNADNYRSHSLGIYRFLGALQSAGTSEGVSFHWGALEAAPFLPRVRYRSIVLARARWDLNRGELDALAKAPTDVDRLTALDRLRIERGIPRHVTFVDGENELVLDLLNPLLVEALLHLVKGRSSVRLMERLPDVDQAPVHGPEGTYAHDVIVPFVRETSASARSEPRPHPVSAPNVRTFGPASEWLYYKIYAGAGLIDRLLAGPLGHAIHSGVGSGAAQQWFFIRYGDPEWHLRLRFRGHPERLREEVMPTVGAALEPYLSTGQIWRVQVDTYQREVERYGGPFGVEMAEQIFGVDSVAVLEILQVLDAENTDARWRLAFRGVDDLLSDFGLNLNQKREVLTPAREGFAREFQVDAALRHTLGMRFRHWRRGLEGLLAGDLDDQVDCRQAHEALVRRSARLRPLVVELTGHVLNRRVRVPMPDYLRAVVHMHVNRVIRSAPRAHEMVLYDFLIRSYDSLLARPS
jgi:thiopeptide-type bacteriocin biosynthesis protein